jgi:hypothetical protein
VEDALGGKQPVRFRQTARRALHSISRMVKYREFMGDRNFMKVLLANFGLNAKDYVIPVLIEKLPVPNMVQNYLQRAYHYVRGN